MKLSVWQSTKKKLFFLNFKMQKKIKSEILETGINLEVIIDIENVNQMPATIFTEEETFRFYMEIVMVMWIFCDNFENIEKLKKKFL